MDGAFVLCRLVHFAAAMVLFGVSLFQWQVAPGDLRASLNVRLRQVAAAAIVAAFVTGIVWLLLAAGEMGDGWADAVSPHIVCLVLFHTEFGAVWVWRLGFICAAVVLFVTGRHDRWPAMTVISALILGSLGLVGHATMQDGGLGLLTRASHILHILAAGFWLGSLIPLVACLQAIENPAASSGAVKAMRRFSGLGHVAVATILATGILNTGLVLGGWPTDLSSPYQTLLLVKIGMVAIMVVLATVNRYALMPRLASRGAVSAVRANTIIEAILGLGALAVVSMMGTLAPV